MGRAAISQLSPANPAGVTRFCDYDPFAWIYSRSWGAGFHDQIFPVLERLMAGRVPPGAPVLDLCCGDGRLSERLLARGWPVTGVEGSERMLEFARQRCPQGEFVLADARSFAVKTQFAAAFCTFDSLNHVLEPAELGAVFENVARSLAPAGLFLFDLNGERAYRDRWTSTMAVADDDAVSVARGDYDSGRRLARCRVTLMQPAGAAWSRSDFELVQRCHDQPSVLAMLSRSGFAPEVHDAAAAGMQGAYSYGREIYVAVKSV